MATEKLTFNGINGATGGYLTPPMTPQEVAQIVVDEERDEQETKELRARYYQASQSFYGLRHGLDPKNLSHAGWGVIFAHDDRAETPAVREALAPLLAMRREQAGDLFKEYAGVDAYRPGESKNDFLVRHGIGPGPADPERVPYYLLIVGSPERIPYRFQYLTDVAYAVGRIHFETLDEYAQYAQSVVDCETGRVSLQRELACLSVNNAKDPATDLSTTQLTVPMAQELAEDRPDWALRKWVGEEATKARLTRLLGGDQTPALLFSASHGMGFPNGHARQLPHQGALVCQDWPGPLAWGHELPQEHFFAGDDVGADARLLGLVAFHFACFGAGTPKLDYFAQTAFRERMALAPHAFVGELPRRLLGHPKGGALAVVGHVDRAWGHSFLWESAGAQRTVFVDTLKRLMDGYPVGWAVEYLNDRYAELATMLTAELEEIKHGENRDDRELAGMWTAHNDARSYVILGDPAVRLALPDDDDAPEERPTITVQPSDVSTLPPIVEAEYEPQPTEPGAPPSAGGAGGSFLPPPGVSTQAQKLREQDEQLYGFWREHVREGYERNSQMFQRILDGFMRPYYTTIWMYRILFAVGVLSLAAAVGLSVLTQKETFALIFGGLGAVAFLSYFISRPLVSLEQNLKFITWLGMVYNTYWTRLVYAMDASTVQADLEDLTQDAIAQVEHLLDKHAEMSGKRPGLGK